jgi:hypothetical protein
MRLICRENLKFANDRIDKQELSLQSKIFIVLVPSLLPHAGFFIRKTPRIFSIDT